MRTIYYKDYTGKWIKFATYSKHISDNEVCADLERVKRTKALNGQADIFTPQTKPI